MLVPYKLRTSLLSIFLAVSSFNTGYSQAPTSNVAERHSEVAGNGKPSLGRKPAAFSMTPIALTGSDPHLEKRGSATQLMVDGKPFLVLGGELQNSSSSN